MENIKTLLVLAIGEMQLTKLLDLIQQKRVICLLSDTFLQLRNVNQSRDLLEDSTLPAILVKHVKPFERTTSAYTMRNLKDTRFLTSREKSWISKWGLQGTLDLPTLMIRLKVLQEKVKMPFWQLHTTLIPLWANVKTFPGYLFCLIMSKSWRSCTQII